MRGLALLLASLLPTVSPVARAEERSSPVELRVLSYNTHGLSAWIAGDDPEWRFPQISLRLAPYDVALIQEDWSYHDLLVSRAHHPVIVRGNGPQGWLRQALGLFGGSGLTTLVGAPADHVLARDAEPLEACAGWLGGANDCLASKGFVRVRVAPGNGSVLDLYNVHLDAGPDEEDREARRAQLDLLARRIQALTGAGAFVLAGDFNADAFEPRDAAMITDLRERLGLRDAAARPVHAEKLLDYVLYRSGDDARLVLLEAGEAEEFRVGDVPLSDHPALRATFLVEPP